MEKINARLAKSEEFNVDGELLRTEIVVWCPGCDCLHSLCVDKKNLMGAVWNWDRNEEAPTFTPSLMVNKLSGNRCHSFIRAGQWQFLSDCHHNLAGKTVDMVDLPGWVFE